MSGFSQKSIPVACSHCSASIGRMVNRDSNIYLDGGDWVIVAGYRHCHCCGKRFTFSPPKKSWDELLARARQQVPFIEETAESSSV